MTMPDSLDRPGTPADIVTPEGPVTFDRFIMTAAERAASPLPEFMTVDPVYDDDVTCVCGNTPCLSGFYPVDHENREVEPDASWTGLVACADCGRYFRNGTDTAGRVQVLGRAPFTPIGA